MGGNSRNKNALGTRGEDSVGQGISQNELDSAKPEFTEGSIGGYGKGGPIKTSPHLPNVDDLEKAERSKMSIYKSNKNLGEIYIKEDISMQNLEGVGGNELKASPGKKPTKSVNFDAMDRNVSLARNIRHTPRSVSKIMSSMDPFGFASKYGRKMSRMSSKNLNSRYPLFFFPNQKLDQ